MNVMMMFWMTITMTMATMVLSIMMISKEKTMIMEWKIMETDGNSMNFALMMDWKSTFFVFTVLLISSSIIMYSKFYMPKSKKTKFIKIILTFVTSMMMLIMSPSFPSMLMGWEGLGMSSFILIMYFMNKKSLMSSIYTMMMNRLGDIMLMLSMMMLMNYSSWMISCLVMYKNKTIMMMLCVSLFSKSAQIPFSSWLTEAMAAPTPVSALVHSSTLVTAGVYMMIRMEMSIKFSSTSKMIMIIATSTMIMASMNATMEWDIKKIVALSTLTQLSTMCISLSMNMYKMAMFHMFMHATFKALIFMCSSSMISMSNSQDIRKISTSNQTSIFTTMSFNTASMSLCGFIFTSGFYSKELIMEMMMINKNSYLTAIVFYMCVAVTMLYSMKMISFSSFNKSKNTTKMMKEEKEQINSKIIILVPSVVLGNKMNWMMNTSTKIPYMTLPEKMIPLTMMLMVIMKIKENYQNKTKQKNNKMKMMVNYMWFMKNFSIKIKILLLKTMMEMMKTSEMGNLTKPAKLTKIKLNKNLMNNFQISHNSFKKMMTLMIMTLITMM